jgi:hypothetical protein
MQKHFVRFCQMNISLLKVKIDYLRFLLALVQLIVVCLIICDVNI